jgi:hypothetical protein
MPSEVPRELAQGMKRAGLHLTPQARRRALVLLASCPDGCTEAIFAAHNLPAEIVAKLLRKGLATAAADRVGRVWITERGAQGADRLVNWHPLAESRRLGQYARLFITRKDAYGLVSYLHILGFGTCWKLQPRFGGAFLFWSGVDSQDAGVLPIRFTR